MIMFNFDTKTSPHPYVTTPVKHRIKMFAFLLFFVIIPSIVVIVGIINILAYIYKWEIIMFLNQSVIPPFDLAFGKKYIDDESVARKNCLISGIVLTTIGAIILLVGFVIYFCW